MKTRLVTYRDGAIDLMFIIDRPRITIGRDTDNMIQLPNERVSKHHAVLLKTKAGWAIEDLQSRNGLFVNGTRTAREDLKNGDRVRIGPFDFYFETNVPHDDYVPSHIIDVSSKVNDQTLTDAGSSRES
jgi:pSer/pThr/pTyr-binding forkhead associated (FHA) protein